MLYCSQTRLFIPSLEAPPTNTIGSLVNIRMGFFQLDVCRECCVLSGRCVCIQLITRAGESYQLWCVVVCNQEASWIWMPCSTWGALQQKKNWTSKARCLGAETNVYTRIYIVQELGSVRYTGPEKCVVFYSCRKLMQELRQYCAGCWTMQLHLFHVHLPWITNGNCNSLYVYVLPWASHWTQCTKLISCLCTHF
jgi:hypothetical protein